MREEREEKGRQRKEEREEVIVVSQRCGRLLYVHYCATTFFDNRPPRLVRIVGFS